MQRDLKFLKLLLQEQKYPYFDDEALEMFLENNEDGIYSLASNLCLMKADMDKKIVVGPITIEGPGADYWINLSIDYSSKASKTNNNSSGSYKTSMKRSDGR